MISLNLYIIVTAVIGIVALLPALPILLDALGLFKVSEANSVWGTIPWYLFYTIPCGGIVWLIWTVVTLCVR